MAEQSVFESAIILLRKETNAGSEGEPPALFPLSWLSDLGTDQARTLAKIWSQLPVVYRRDLISRMEEEARKNFELDFTAIARISLADDDPEVRGHAVRALWECDDLKLADRFLQLLEKDADPLVRACAADALGSFMDRAELEEIPADVSARVERGLIGAFRGTDDLDVRRKALESISFLSNAQVSDMIQTAYRHPDERMRVSALKAMGRTFDSQWSDQVVQEMKSVSHAMRAEASRAAGELVLRKTVPLLVQLLEDADSSVRRNAIWSLGEIGGTAARHALEKLQNRTDEDDEESDLVEEALDNAEFQESLGDPRLLEQEADDSEFDDEEIDDEEDSSDEDDPLKDEE